MTQFDDALEDDGIDVAQHANPARQGGVGAVGQRGGDAGAPLPGVAGAGGGLIAEGHDQNRVDDRLDLGLADPGGLDDRRRQVAELPLGLEALQLMKGQLCVHGPSVSQGACPGHKGI